MKKTILDHQLFRRSLAAPFLAAALLVPQAGNAQTPDAPPVVEEESFIPQAYRPSRYDDTITNNPFEREIVKPEPAPIKDPPPPFNLKLIGMLRSGDTYRITLIDAAGKYQVVTQNPDDNGEGYHYTDVEPAPMIQNAKVYITKDGKTEPVTFDEKRFSTKAGLPTIRTPKNTKDRRTFVPSGTNRNLPKDAKTKAHDKKTGAQALEALNKSKEAANKAAQERAARAEQRRVVLPPPPKK